MLAMAIIHIYQHRIWYKTWNFRRLSKRINTSILTLLCGSVVITGIILLLFIDGENSTTGFWHYRLGLVMSLIALIHIIKRVKILFKPKMFKKSTK